MFISPTNDLLPPPKQRPEKNSEVDPSGSSASISASLVPNERQTVNGVEVLRDSSNLASNYPNMPRARIYHPRQAPSAVLSENFLAARASLSPGFIHNIVQTNIARVSNAYRDVPQFRNELDILA